ncbi:sepiapterin reductase a [Hippoglossus hippoglossus]|uniref:sepiapterin reductase a n=1 Tax=Hippoglossus hippoglossus TaxID=8267 RepID=UPI00148E427B|nr:sepiapterin reductase a [Hippoglossus hippoglossus]
MSSSGTRTDLGRALCIITGASRGFGRVVARHMSELLKPGSALVLAARSGDELRAAAAEVTGAAAGGGGLLVLCVPVDLSHSDGVTELLAAVKTSYTDDMDHVLLVNNAGSLGDISRYMTSFTNMAEVDSYLSFNVSSSLCLTASVLEAFPRRPGLRRTVVNVTSLCALKPHCSWVLYCTGKAAREMMFRVLAEEEPDVRVLSYSPGPLDTDMFMLARSRTADPDLRKSLSDMFAQGQVLTCDESCTKMMKVLLEDQYVSGSHVDIYEV